MKGVNRFSSVDNDVAVFGRVIKNEIDQEFVLVQKQLKEAVVDLLKAQIKGKNPMKGDDVINNILQRKIQVKKKTKQKNTSVTADCSS